MRSSESHDQLQPRGNTDLLFIRNIVSINSMSDLTILPWRIKRAGRRALVRVKNANSPA